MDLLGIDPNSIGEDDNLAGMGIDSMQVVEVRARIQRALGRPIPLEEVRPGACVQGPGSFSAQGAACTAVCIMLIRKSMAHMLGPVLQLRVAPRRVASAAALTQRISYL